MTRFPGPLSVPRLLSGLMVLAVSVTPVLADHGKHRHDKGPGKGKDHAGWRCPPGLAKKNPPCVPPGQAKKHARAQDHRFGIGDRLDLGDVIRINDPLRYGLPVNGGWDYYRDSAGIYRVDAETRKILAVLQLLEAFAP